MKFTYEAYGQLIQTIREAGYKRTDYHSFHNENRCCILRHDVDMDLGAAADFAQFEANMKEGPISATYFVLISSGLYNLYSKECMENLKRIIRAGHEIGLHFDEKRYLTEEHFDRGYLQECVLREAALLSDMLEKRVRCVSMHRPSKQFLEEDICFDGIVNSYSEKFFREFKYMSDSRMSWRENAEQVITERKEQKLHILTHPIWYSQRERNLRDVLKTFIQSALPVRYDQVKDNFTNLQDVITLEDFI